MCVCVGTAGTGTFYWPALERQTKYQTAKKSKPNGDALFRKCLSAVGDIVNYENKIYKKKVGMSETLAKE